MKDEFDRNPKYDGCQRALASMVYKLFDKKARSAASVTEELAEKLHKPAIQKTQKKKSLCEIIREDLGGRFT